MPQYDFHNPSFNCDNSTWLKLILHHLRSLWLGHISSFYFETLISKFQYIWNTYLCPSSSFKRRNIILYGFEWIYNLFRLRISVKYFVQFHFFIKPLAILLSIQTWTYLWPKPPFVYKSTEICLDWQIYVSFRILVNVHILTSIIWSIENKFKLHIVVSDYDLLV